MGIGVMDRDGSWTLSNALFSSVSEGFALKEAIPDPEGTMLPKPDAPEVLVERVRALVESARAGR